MGPPAGGTMGFTIGQNVTHKSYGKGIVVAQHYDNKNVWNVNFGGSVIAINGKNLSRS
jgi:hypothetical protein